MTESEAIEELKYDCNELGKAIPCDTSWGSSFENAYRMAIQALEEVQKYREIGSIEECREAREKRIAKKPDFTEDKEFALCPCCNGKGLLNKQKYCDNCGQKLDWSDENEVN